MKSSLKQAIESLAHHALKYVEFTRGYSDCSPESVEKLQRRFPQVNIVNSRSNGDEGEEEEEEEPLFLHMDASSSEESEPEEGMSGSDSEWLPDEEVRNTSYNLRRR